MVNAKEFAEYINLLLKEGYLGDPREIVYVEDKRICFLNLEKKSGKASARDISVTDLSSYPVDNENLIIIKEVLGTIGEPAFLMMSTNRYTKTAAAEGSPVKPYLDDFAQMMGTGVRAVEYKKAAKALQKSSAVLVKETGGLCRSDNLYDLHAVAMVLEKGCQAQIESWILGGGKKISFLEALLMRMIYLKKYSKEAQTT